MSVRVVGFSLFAVAALALVASGWSAPDNRSNAQTFAVGPADEFTSSAPTSAFPNAEQVAARLSELERAAGLEPNKLPPELIAELEHLPAGCGASLQRAPHAVNNTHPPIATQAAGVRAEQQTSPSCEVYQASYQQDAAPRQGASYPYATLTQLLPPGAEPRLPERPDDLQEVINQAHADCYLDDPYPSAAKCKTCHPGHYREWSVSAHAYAQLSPVFNAMSSQLNVLNNGTLGDFCVRCHTPVGLAMGEPVVMSNMDRHPSAREGVTCVVCHRINQAWGKGAGRQFIQPGGLNSPVYGPTGAQNLEMVLANPDRYGTLKTAPDPNARGRDVHQTVIPFYALTEPGFCGACHDVFAPNGFRLEDAFSEFKSGAAAREKHQSCQDCHMSVRQGEASGFACEPAAQVGNVTTPPRKRTSHMIAGPDYSIVHPGLFPHNPDLVREEHPQFQHTSPYNGLATMRDWLQFDYKAGWGRPEFERQIPQGYVFPTAWQDQGKRYRASDLLKGQFELLAEMAQKRQDLLAIGYQLRDIELTNVDRNGIDFRILVFNGTDGHGVPTGFDAERLVFLRVTVVDRNGNVVFVSGDLDPNGDVRDNHSFYVHNGHLPLDRHLFSLQTKFITRNNRGGEREQILNVPYSLDPLPYIRPEPRPFTIDGRPQGARKQKRNLAANNGERYATYHIDAAQLTCQGPYYAQVQLVAGMVPVNLVQAISSVGFDYDMSPREVANAVVEGHQVLHVRDAVFHVHEQ